MLLQIAESTKFIDKVSEYSISLGILIFVIGGLAWFTRTLIEEIKKFIYRIHEAQERKDIENSERLKKLDEQDLRRDAFIEDLSKKNAEYQIQTLTALNNNTQALNTNTECMREVMRDMQEVSRIIKNLDDRIK